MAARRIIKRVATHKSIRRREKIHKGRKHEFVPSNEGKSCIAGKSVSLRVSKFSWACIFAGNLKTAKVERSVVRDEYFKKKEREFMIGCFDHSDALIFSSF